MPTQLNQVTRMKPARHHAKTLGRKTRKNGRGENVEGGSECFGRIGVTSLERIKCPSILERRRIVGGRAKRGKGESVRANVRGTGR